MTARLPSMTKEHNPEKNMAEVRDLSTHEMGAVDMHETIVTDEPVTIEPADAPGKVTTERNKQ
jgi:hypothetical protein